MAGSTGAERHAAGMPSEAGRGSSMSNCPARGSRHSAAKHLDGPRLHGAPCRRLVAQVVQLSPDGHPRVVDNHLHHAHPHLLGCRPGNVGGGGGGGSDRVGAELKKHAGVGTEVLAYPLLL